MRRREGVRWEEKDGGGGRRGREEVRRREGVRWEEKDGGGGRRGRT